MRLRAVILGCGSSGGVPRLGGAGGQGNWGACDPKEPKNRRTRCSLLVQRADETLGWAAPALTSVLVDTSPDLREQLLAAKCDRLDAVLFTHDHADQTHGIDDLRMIAINMSRQVDVFIDDHTAGRLVRRFDYCFAQRPDGTHPPIIKRQFFPPLGHFFHVTGPTGTIPISTFLQHHGAIDSLGFVFGQGTGRLAYSSDVKDMPEQSFEHLTGIDSWILDALQRVRHPSHSHLEQSLAWLKKMRVRSGILTNLHTDLDYQTLRAQLPDHIQPAYDRLTIEWCVPGPSGGKP